MNNKTKKMIEDYEKAVNAIATLFLNKQFGEDGEPPIEIGNGSYDASYWCGDEVGVALCYNETDYYDFSDILTDIKEDAPEDELDKYNDYCTRCIDLGLEPKINYHWWLHGAPRTSDEELNRLEKMKADFAAEIERTKNEKES